MKAFIQSVKDGFRIIDDDLLFSSSSPLSEDLDDFNDFHDFHDYHVFHDFKNDCDREEDFHFHSHSPQSNDCNQIHCLFPLPSSMTNPAIQAMLSFFFHHFFKLSQSSPNSTEIKDRIHSVLMVIIHSPFLLDSPPSL